MPGVTKYTSKAKESLAFAVIFDLGVIDRKAKEGLAFAADIDFGMIDRKAKEGLAFAADIDFGVIDRKAKEDLAFNVSIIDFGSIWDEMVQEDTAQVLTNPELNQSAAQIQYYQSGVPVTIDASVYFYEDAKESSAGLINRCTLFIKARDISKPKYLDYALVPMPGGGPAEKWNVLNISKGTRHIWLLNCYQEEAPKL